MEAQYHCQIDMLRLFIVVFAEPDWQTGTEHPYPCLSFVGGMDAAKSGIVAGCSRIPRMSWEYETDRIQTRLAVMDSLTVQQHVLLIPVYQEENRRSYEKE